MTISVFLKKKGEKLKKVEEAALKCSHKEAYFRTLFHAKFINALNTVVIRTADTDILVFALCDILLFATSQNFIKG